MLLGSGIITTDCHIRRCILGHSERERELIINGERKGVKRRHCVALAYALSVVMADASVILADEDSASEDDASDDSADHIWDDDDDDDDEEEDDEEDDDGSEQEDVGALSLHSPPTGTNR